MRPIDDKFWTELERMKRTLGKANTFFYDELLILLKKYGVTVVEAQDLGLWPIDKERTPKPGQLLGGPTGKDAGLKRGRT